MIQNSRPPVSPWLQGGGQSPQQQPQQPQPHPLFQGRDMAHQMPPTPHSGAVHQLLQHAIPIYHQVSAIKKAMGSKSGKPGNNPGGVSNF